MSRAARLRGTDFEQKAGQPEPSLTAPVYEVSRCRPDYPHEHVPLYGNDRWDLRGLQPPHASAAIVNFERAPKAWVGPIRRALWSMLNVDNDHEGANGRARRPAGATVHRAGGFAIAFANWAVQAGASSPLSIDDELYEDFAAALRITQASRPYRENQLRTLSDLALAGERIWGLALPRPPWLEHGVDAYVGGQRETSGENLREPIPQEVMAPLIVWALRYVNDFSDDILAAKSERDRIQAQVSRSASPGAPTRLRAYFESLRRSGRAVPSVLDGPTGKVCVAQQYIGSLTQAGTDQVGYYLEREFGDLAVGEPVVLVEVPAGRVGDCAWRGPILFEDVPRLCTLLHSAALIVVAYLTGMRPAELLTLRRGCSSRFVEADGRVLYEIRGRQFKHQREDGIAIPEGRTRDQPWYAMAAVAQAIGVVERLHGADLLWPAKAPWSLGGAQVAGQAAMRPETATVRIMDFVEAARRLALDHQRAHELIPEVPRIALGAFRRTLAWFIVWQPGGDVAAGIQYGHLEPLVTTQGYSGRSRSRAGLGDVINMERLRRVVDGLADAVDRLDAGERVSGPAADVYKDRARRFKETFGGRLLNDRQMSQIRTMPDLRIYESPNQFLTCVMDPAKALCLTDRGRTPDTAPTLSRCSSHCPNGARTDRHAVELRDEVSHLRQEARNDALPQPLRIRISQRADVLEAQASKHEETGKGHRE